MGQKPLYWTVTDRHVVFASELKAFRTVPDWRGEIDRRSVGYLMHLSAIPAPSTIYRETYMLEPGTALEIREGDLGGRGFPPPEPYWSLSSAMERAKGDPFPADEEAAEEAKKMLGRTLVTHQTGPAGVGFTDPPRPGTAAEKRTYNSGSPRCH